MSVSHEVLDKHRNRVLRLHPNGPENQSVSEVPVTGILIRG